MSDGQKETSRQNVEKVRDLFGLAHDLIAQAQFPGHVSPKVAEVMQFLAWQYQDFKQRGEAFAKAEKAETPVPAQPEAPAEPAQA